MSNQKFSGEIQMLLYKSLHFTKPFSTSTESKTKSLNWRIQIKQNQLISQISSILLQRKNWVIPLQNLNLSSKLTPLIFLQILQKIKQDPKISLRFFNWVRTSLGFKPDLKSHCRIIQIAVASGFSNHVEHILDYMVQDHPASLVADSMIHTCKGNDSKLNPLSLVIRCYADKGLSLQGLEVFRRMRIHNYKPSIHSCNSLLDALYRDNQIKFALCLYSAMVRDEVSVDISTWSLLAQILSKIGKMEGVVRLIDIGIYNSVIYDLVIEHYSRNRDFSSAFSKLNQMFDRKLNPDFNTCSLILDEACKSENIETMNRITTLMVEKKLYPEFPLRETDSIIRKLCDSSRTHAAEMVFKTACNKNIEMKDSTYGLMLTSLSTIGRIKEAIEIYHMICSKGLLVNDDSYNAFVNALCAYDRSNNGYELLRDVIRRGFIPTSSNLSKYIESKCRKGRFREADEILTTILDMGLLPDSFSCCSLVGHYCSRRELDKAMVLHNEMVKTKGGLDVKTYNVLIDGLFKSGRVEEALSVFGYMDGLSLCSGASFTIMVHELCRVGEMRNAMKIHDEMLEKGLKPDDATYKRVISGFKL